MFGIEYISNKVTTNKKLIDCRIIWILLYYVILLCWISNIKVFFSIVLSALFVILYLASDLARNTNLFISPYKKKKMWGKEK